jgi:hypothetical protein
MKSTLCLLLLVSEFLSWSLSLQEEHKLIIVEKRKLRRKLRPQKQEVRGAEKESAQGCVSPANLLTK